MLKLMRLGLFAAALTAAFPLASALAEVGRPYGNWSMGKVTIKVKDCGGGLCGTIVALKEPISKIDGKLKVKGCIDGILCKTKNFVRIN